MAHNHSVYDSDTRFEINPITRQIKNESSSKTTLMQGDHNSETFTFGLPRYIEGHDMSLCNKVEVHYFNIDSKTKEVRSGVYTAEDFMVDPDDESKVVFSWCVSGNSTHFTGLLKFRIRYKCEEDKIVTYSWNTAFFTGISVGEGEDAAEMFETEYVDIIEQWKESVVKGFEDDLKRASEDVKGDIAKWEEAASANVIGEMTKFSEQWNDTLDVERVRIDELIQMRTTTGTITHAVDNDTIHVDVVSNGIEAYLSFQIKDLRLEEGDFYDCMDLPVALAPMVETDIPCADQNLKALIFYQDGDYYNTVLRIRNTTTGRTVSGLTGGGRYALAFPSISELTDIRVGHDGRVYRTAGDAVREQIKFVASKTMPVDDVLILGSTNPVQAGAIVEEFQRTHNMINELEALIEAGGGGGSGGGGGGYTYTVSLKNLMDDRSITIAENGKAEILFSYSSVDEDGIDDGNGVGTITVNSVKVATVNVSQGENALDVSQYLSAGFNEVKIKVENTEGTYRMLSYSVNVIALTLSTTMDLFTVCQSDVTFYYTPVGNGTKTVHFLIDGEEFATEEVTSSGRSQSKVIPMQSHGAHTVEVYAEMTVNGVSVTSNTLTLGLLCIETNDMTPVLGAIFASKDAMQGETLSIPYFAYSPISEPTMVTLSVIDADGDVYSTRDLMVDRTEQMWSIQDYPAGDITFRLSMGSSAVVDFPVTVAESGIVIEPVTDSLVFTFNPSGRSNGEDNPGQWSDGTVSAEFSGVGFSGADGWMDDSDGNTVLRLLPGGAMTIPFNLFNTDKRTNGVTVEVEMATHNVRDYDSIVMSCLSGGRGFQIASQYAKLNSEQSEIGMQFKEDERVRVSFVVEPRNLNRLIYVYVDGIMCGAIQYPTDDNFAQNPAVGITVGAESSGIDVYRIYLYDKGLTRNEVLNNYIADRSTLSERIAAYNRNDLLDVSEEIVISKLPATLPYMIISCGELPQYKGHKQTCEIAYVNPGDSGKSFTAGGVEIDVQGTSSAGYKKKNFKIKLKNGLTYTKGETKADVYGLRDDSIPVDVFCLKADVASSESANNVELVRLYNDTCPHKTDAQKENSRVRVGIDGLPMVVFWHNTNTNETRFWGKYNFNNDKSNEVVFGLTDGCESWEILNNTSDRVIFKRSNYSDDTWMSDFEARYPDGNKDYTNLKRLTDWIVSTDRSAVSTNTAKTARLNKFKSEFEDYFVKAPMLFYYLFTEVFLMVDNRAKNFFPSTYDGIHWMPLPYDMDTAIGINNEGQLVFDYDLEDTDKVSGANVFNGQESVLWCNIRDAFADELAEMYADLRNGTLFTYEEVVKRFKAHQGVWPEAVWNEDAFEKYLEPLLNDGDGSYLTMLQGNKASQREWWLHNGFRYRDSKYQSGDANKQFITLRCYEVGDITVTPYSHIWPRIKYGSYTVTERGKRNVPTTLVCPLDTMDDTEVYIYSADRLSEIGDLSPLQVGYANFSMAAKLQKLKLGDGADSYTNTHLTELYVGNNDLLAELDIQNCVNLKQAVDLSDCSGLETIRAKGSAVTALTLPVGGNIKTMELPATITNLTIREQKQLETLTLEGYSNITTLRIENTPNVPIEAVLAGSNALDRVRLIGVEWTPTSNEALESCITKLLACGGMDATGGNTDKAVVSGKLYADSVSSELLDSIYENFPDLVVVVNGEITYCVRYLDTDGTVLYKALVADGDDAIDPVALGYIDVPTREGTEDCGYLFSSWGALPTDIHSNQTVVAQYVVTWAVRFYNEGVLVNTQYVQDGLAAVDPVAAGYINAPIKESTAQYDYTYSGWDKAFGNITEAVNVNAVYSETLRTYTVTFYNGDTLLQSVTVPYGGSATYTGDTPVKEGDYAFKGWAPEPTNITADIDCYAEFKSTAITWTDVLGFIADGTYKENLSIGDTVPLDLGTEGVVNMQVVAFDADQKADGSGYAPITWIARELLTSKQCIHSGGTATGWDTSELKTYLEGTIKPMLPAEVRNALVTVYKYHCCNPSSAYERKDSLDIWIPSMRELNDSYCPREKSAPIYADVYTNGASRKKSINGATTLERYWTRTTELKTSWYYIQGSSAFDRGNENPNTLMGVCLGFCT